MNPTEFLQSAYITLHAFSIILKSKLKSKHICTKWYRIQIRVTKAHLIQKGFQLLTT